MCIKISWTVANTRAMEFQCWERDVYSKEGQRSSPRAQPHTQVASSICLRANSIALLKHTWVKTAGPSPGSLLWPADEWN